MENLPEGSVVVCMGGTVKLMTGREWLEARELEGEADDLKMYTSEIEIL